MPPPVPSVSDYESEYWAESESVHSDDANEPKPLEAKPEEASNTIAGLDLPAPRISQSYTSPYTHFATGAHADNGKRKAESGNGDSGHAAKTRRTESSGVDSALEESDDEEGIPYGTYLHSIPVVNGATPGSTSHASRKTTLALFQEKYPHLRSQPERPGNLFTYLSRLPAVRIPVTTHRFNDVKPQNISAFLMQAAGDVVPWEEACERCTRQSGMLREACVVVRDPDVQEVTGGACANCWYNRLGSTCTFRQWTTTAPQRMIAKESPVPAAQQKPPKPAPAPVPAAPTPIHPSYAAALATGTVAAAPAPAAGVPTSSSATSSNLSRDAKVRVWENRYGGMGINDLLRAHVHLEEWQEDLTTRLIAMNRVVLAKLMERSLDS